MWALIYEKSSSWISSPSSEDANGFDLDEIVDTVLWRTFLASRRERSVSIEGSDWGELVMTLVAKVVQPTFWGLGFMAEGRPQSQSRSVGGSVARDSRHECRRGGAENTRDDQSRIPRCAGEAPMRAVFDRLLVKVSLGGSRWFDDDRVSTLRLGV